MSTTAYHLCGCAAAGEADFTGEVQPAPASYLTTDGFAMRHCAILVSEAHEQLIKSLEGQCLALQGYYPDMNHGSSGKDDINHDSRKDSGAEAGSDWPWKIGSKEHLAYQQEILATAGRGSATKLDADLKMEYLERKQVAGVVRDKFIKLWHREHTGQAPGVLQSSSQEETEPSQQQPRQKSDSYANLTIGCDNSPGPDSLSSSLSALHSNGNAMYSPFRSEGNSPVPVAACALENSVKHMAVRCTSERSSFTDVGQPWKLDTVWYHTPCKYEGRKQIVNRLQSDFRERVRLRHGLLVSELTSPKQSNLASSPKSQAFMAVPSALSPTWSTTVAASVHLPRLPCAPVRQASIPKHSAAPTDSYPRRQVPLVQESRAIRYDSVPLPSSGSSRFPGSSFKLDRLSPPDVRPMHARPDKYF